MTTLVLVEVEADGVAETSLETITFARDRFAGFGTPLEALVVGPMTAELVTTVLGQLGRQGATVLHHADDDHLTSYSAAAWAAAIVDIAKPRSPRAVLAVGTPRGGEVMAHVATRLGVAMAANVVAVEAQDPLLVSRQVMGGSALEEMRLEDSTAVLTVAGHSTVARDVDSPSNPANSVFAPPVADSDLVTRVAEIEPKEKADTAALATARVVVGAGRGVGRADAFGDLLELTDLLGGTLGVSRVVTSLGWRPHHEQVGQTGSRIAPDLYVACGISGAIQHWAGCQNAKTIIAINTDRDAPMVTKAHYAVIGDLHEIVPAINAEIRKRRS